ncbi:MAG TPA: pyrimidine 5'-nucleotidase [Caulobacteraceae bacterium]|jgi:putative hydrolase of the HAD superfamily|nr:pyrimidine 5'-nucleotidase [Caulobacteraceae bacterium]
MTADLRHIEVWLFDLDNTLYPPETAFMGLIEARMTDFVARHVGLPRDEAHALQKRYYRELGTTLAGLMANHGVKPEDYLDDVHDVPLDSLTPDPELAAAIRRLPGRRLVFTNGDQRHAGRVLDHLGLADLFDNVFHIASADYVPKPHPDTFDRLIKAHAIAPRDAAFFEDSEKNLAPAAALGMTTILVGPHAEASTAPFVHHRTRRLAPFLNAARVRETAA